MDAFDKEGFSISGKIVNKKEKELLMKNNCRWCAKCQKAKSIDSFWASQYGCIECSKETKQKWDSSHPDYYSNYRQDNVERQKQAHKSWFERNKEKKNLQNKEWYNENKESIKLRHKMNRQKLSSNPQFKLSKALRQRVYSFLLGSKSIKTMDLLGCSMEDLKTHLESQFTEGMSWENYGNPNGNHSNCWHMDHIRPCCSFDLTIEEEQRKCFHYSNLQPLWAIDNIKKGSKY